MMQQVEYEEGGAVSLCSMRVESEVFGIDTLQVHEVLGESMVHPVPLTHDFIGGMMPYRGEVLLVLCSRRLLGLPVLARPASVLVLRSEQENELFGLGVDEVKDVLTVDRASFEQNPCTLDARRKAIFAGVYKLRDGVVVRLEPELLRPARLAELQDFSGRRSEA